MTRKRLIPINSSPATTDAEKLIEMARVANILLRQGASVNDVCVLVKCTLEHCEVALAFFTANDGLKLRALVEDWPLPVIKRECLCEGRSFGDCTLVP